MGHLEFEDEYGESPAEIVAENEITAVQKLCPHNDTIMVKSCCGEKPQSINGDADEVDFLYCSSCQCRFFLIEFCNDCGHEKEIE